MLRLDKRGQGLSITVIVSLVLALVFLVLALSVIGVFKVEFLNVEAGQETGCWLSNSIKCGEGAFVAWPTLCSLSLQEEPVGIEKLSDMVRTTWYMFKQGECDFGNVEDDIYQVYAFEVEEDIEISEFFKYIRSHNRKRGPVEVKNSDYAYIEEGSELNTICFDQSDTEGIANGKLAKGQTYYISYYDDVELIEIPSLKFEIKSDAILISNDPGFDKGHFQKVLFDTWAATLALQGPQLAVGAAIVAPALIPLGTVAGAVAGYNLYVYRTDNIEGCLLYGLQAA